MGLSKPGQVVGTKMGRARPGLAPSFTLDAQAWLAMAERASPAPEDGAARNPPKLLLS